MYQATTEEYLVVADEINVQKCLFVFCQFQFTKVIEYTVSCF